MAFLSTRFPIFCCSTKGIDDLCMKYLVEAGVMGVRRVPKGDIKRLAGESSPNARHWPRDFVWDFAFVRVDTAACFITLAI